MFSDPLSLCLFGRLKPSISHGNFQQEKEEEITTAMQKGKREEEKEDKDKDVVVWQNMAYIHGKEEFMFLKLQKDHE